MWSSCDHGRSSRLRALPSWFLLSPRRYLKRAVRTASSIAAQDLSIDAYAQTLSITTYVRGMLARCSPGPLARATGCSHWDYSRRPVISSDSYNATSCMPPCESMLTDLQFLGLGTVPFCRSRPSVLLCSQARLLLHHIPTFVVGIQSTHSRQQKLKLAEPTHRATCQIRDRYEQACVPQHFESAPQAQALLPAELASPVARLVAPSAELAQCRPPLS